MEGIVIQRCLAFLNDFQQEVTRFLSVQAESMLLAGVTDGEVQERLKWMMAEYDLPCATQFVLGAMDSATMRLRSRASPL